MPKAPIIHMVGDVRVWFVCYSTAWRLKQLSFAVNESVALIFRVQIYGRNVFMQEQLPPAFSNSEVSATSGLSPSECRIASS